MKPFSKKTISTSLLLLLTSSLSSTAFQFPSLPAFFQPSSSSTPSKSLPSQTQQLLTSISNTNNGKSATIEQQSEILTLTRSLELTYPPPTNLFDDDTSKQLLDGVWFLQYTSPSQLQISTEDDDADDTDNTETNDWIPINASEGTSKIPTNQFAAQGSISAKGITVDTSNKAVLQIIDLPNLQIRNEVELDFGKVMVGGSIRPSETVSNRVIVAFEYGFISLDKLVGGLKVKVDLGNVFRLIGFFRGTMDSGWLETTFLTEGVRIGRGNKGTMFVLTRNREDVIP